jgi:SAM-dependent methyltransferase
MPFADGSFNTVIANCVVEHIPDLDAALRETFRVLRPGGRFLFGVPSHLFGEMLLVPTIFRSLKLKRLARAYGDWFNRHSRHFHTYDPQSWLERLERHGFRVEHREYYLTPAAHRAFDLAHYLSVPRLLSRKLTGKWMALPNPVSNYLFERWLRPHYETRPTHEGPYIFFHTRKAGR